jgi:NAD-dependent DNA ligase
MTREEVQDKAKRLGATIRTAVNSHTDFLVVGEGAGSVKVQKAKQLQVQVVEEKEFREALKLLNL